LLQEGRPWVPVPPGASLFVVSLLFGSVLGFAELAVMFFFFTLMLEPCNFVASVMKFGQKPLVEKALFFCSGLCLLLVLIGLQGEMARLVYGPSYVE
jgi:hypothetical protein